MLQIDFGRYFSSASLRTIVFAMVLVPPALAQSAEADDAQNASSQIVVTAQRREERSVDVPISITALSPEAMSVANVQNLSDTAKITPGLRFDSQGPAVQPTIRGVGTAITTSGGGPNVGIYVDGFFQANTYVADFQLLKVQSIQILKGPQGTLFGRNTTGGAILVDTADIGDARGAEFKLRYGRFGAVQAQAYVTQPLSERVAVDIEGIYSYGDGFQKNILNSDTKIGQYRNWSVRTGLKAELTDDISLLLRYIHSEADNPNTQLVNAYVDVDGSSGFFSKLSPGGQAIYGKNSSAGQPLVYFYAPAGTFATKPGEIALNQPVSFTTKSDTAQATLKADLGFANFTSYSQYRRDKTPYFGDLDVTTLPFFQINVPVEDETVSQEFLLSSHAGSPLQWTAGLNYFRIRDTWDVNASFGTPFFAFGGSSTTTTSYAGFADLTYQASEKFFVTLGGRYSHDVVSDAYFTINPFTQAFIGKNGESVPSTGLAPGTRVPVDNLSNNSFTPRVVVRYQTTDQSSLYASFTRGYKAGILNVGGLSKQPVKPEKINAFEAGFKFDNRRLAVDLAAFYYDYSNLQVSSYQNGSAQIRNAASSEIYGLEGQIRYRVGSAFNIFAGAAYTHARYKSFVNSPFYTYCDPLQVAPSPLVCSAYGPGSLTQTTTDASGFQMQRAPEFTGNIGASYSLDLAGGQMKLSGNLYYTSSFYFDPSEQFRQPGYELVSLRAEWTDPSDRFTVAAYGDNVTGQRYLSQVLFNTLGIGSVWNSPATYGLELGYKF